MAITPQQKHFFDTFGYLVLPGLLKDEIGWISDGFLENFIAAKARFWVDHSHSEIMRNTASPQRMRHLQQVIDHEGHLPALSAKARLTMNEPARG